MGEYWKYTRMNSCFSFSYIYIYPSSIIPIIATNILLHDPLCFLLDSCLTHTVFNYNYLYQPPPVIIVLLTEGELSLYCCTLYLYLRILTIANLQQISVVNIPVITILPTEANLRHKYQENLTTFVSAGPRIPLELAYFVTPLLVTC